MIKLIPSQIVYYWDMLREAIKSTFVQREFCTDETLQNILKLLLAERAQCWIVLDREQDEGSQFKGFVITRISFEEFTGQKVLSVDCAYAYSGVPDDLLFKGTEVLKAFAKKEGCAYLTALTADERIAMLTVKLGYTKRFYLFQEV